MTHEPVMAEWHAGRPGLADLPRPPTFGQRAGQAWLTCRAPPPLVNGPPPEQVDKVLLAQVNKQTVASSRSQASACARCGPRSHVQCCIRTAFPPRRTVAQQHFPLPPGLQ